MKISAALSIDKRDVKNLALELYNLLISSRSKKENNASQEEQTISGAAAAPVAVVEDSPLLKKEKELLFKQIEVKLFAAYRTEKDPFWFNLLLIENTRDYPYNKYNSLACLTAKYFENWLSMPSNRQLASTYKFTSDLKISAFIVASKHHLLMLDSLFKSYQVYKDNAFLLPFVSQRIKSLDYKDKAILISSVMMHDHFDFEEVG